MSVHDLVPDLVPKYLVTVGTRWYLLGLAAAPLYQRVPTRAMSRQVVYEALCSDLEYLT